MNDWEMEAIILRDSDGTMLAHSQSTDAYRIYGTDPELALEVGEAQGIAHGQNGEGLAEHFRNTADTRDRIEQQFAERNSRR